MFLRCIELEPDFVKAYLRKAKVHAGMGQPSKALSAYKKASELDPNCSEAIEGYKSCTIQASLPSKHPFVCLHCPIINPT